MTKAIVKMPAGHVRDSGLLHYLLRIKTLDQLQTDPAVGLSFESLMGIITNPYLQNQDAYWLSHPCT